MTRKVRILYMVSRLGPTGPTKQLYYILKHIDLHNFDPHLICLSDSKSNLFKTKIEALDIKIENFKYSRLEILYNIRKLIRHTNIINPDIIHTQGYRPDLISANYMKKYTRLCTIRNYPWHDYPQKFGKLIGYSMAYSHVKALRKVRTPVACSTSIGDKMKSHLGEINAIQNGIEIPEFTNSSYEHVRKMVRSNLGIPNNTKIFLSVGSLIERKNPMFMLSCFHTFNYMYNETPWVLIILGDGPLINEMKAYVKLNSIPVIFLGYKTKVEDYFKASDYHVSFSLSEGLPNTVLEALVNHCPCILSNISPHREIQEASTSTIQLFDIKKNTQDIASEIKNHIVELKNVIEPKLFDKAKSHFSADKMSKNYQELYNLIVSKV